MPPKSMPTEKHAFMLFIAGQYVQATLPEQRAELADLIDQDELKVAYQDLLRQKLSQAN